MAAPSTSAALQPQGNIYNYVVTAHKPTAVIKSVVGSFTGPNETNLILAKSTKIEVHRLNAQGLEAVLELPIHGRVSCIELFRPKGKSQDNLFVLVEKLKICVLEYDANTGEVITRAHGDVRDNIGNPSTNGQLAAIDPEGRAIAMHLYDGLVKVIPLGERGRLQDAFNARIEELCLVDLCFLTGCDRPTLAALYEDSKKARHVKTYELKLMEKEMQEGPWSQQNVDPGSGLVIPVPAPLGGIIVVGESIVVYLSGEGSPAMRAAPIKQTVMTAYGRIDPDGSRYLLGDYLGNMYLLVLAHNGETALGLKMEIVGHTSAPSSISYLDAGVVFVGSRAGDSQLVRLHSEPVNPAEPNNYVEVLETYTNLGPIVDFCVVDPEGQGQGQVVTCSGIKADGSLRIVRNGIGINEQASVELHGIKGVWSLRQAWADTYDKYLVLTFVGETRMLAINQDDELDEAEISGFDAAAQTLYCGNTLHDQLVQVTSTGVRLVDASSHMLLSSWAPAAGFSINVAAGSPTQVLLATGAGHLVYLEVTQASGGSLEEKANIKLDSEIACVDISPLSDDTPASSIAAVGTWALSLHLFSLPTLAPLATEQLGGEVIPRSVLLNSFDGVPYCLVGLGDGQLLNWRLDAARGVLSDRKRVLLGTKPILLKTFKSNGALNVFAGSDRPTIIYSSNKKIVFSNLNENEVHLIATFNSASFNDCLAIAKEGALTIGSVEEIQKLHVRTVPLHEQPRRIVHQEATKTFGVVTIASVNYEEQSFLRVLDDQSFDVVASYPMQHQELVCSIASVSFGDASSSTPYYVVGTAFVRPEEAEPTKGRIVVLQYTPEERRLSVVTEREVKGTVYQLLPFQSKLLNTCNSKVQIHKLVTREDGTKELRADCSHAGNVLALYLATRGDFILVGDLMRSVSLLVYKPEEETLEMRAQDFNTNWTTAVEMLDDDVYVVGENSYNLLVLRKVNDAATDEERGRLEAVGEYHTGEFINRFRHGSLVMKLPDVEVATFPTLLYASTDGSLGLLASVPPQWFDFLSKLQDAMRKVVKGVGGWDHASFRAFANERKTSDARGFVDGDLVESFLDVGKDVQAQVVALMGSAHEFTVESVVKRVEELAQGLH